MKHHFSLLAAVALALAGCSKEEAPAPAPNTPAAKPADSSSGNPITAPVDYLGAVAKAKKVAEKGIDTASLNQAIQLFNAQEGRFPKDLKELVTQKYLNSIPEAPYNMKIEYDAAKGEVKVVPK